MSNIPSVFETFFNSPTLLKAGGATPIFPVFRPQGARQPPSLGQATFSVLPDIESHPRIAHTPSRFSASTRQATFLDSLALRSLIPDGGSDTRPDSHAWTPDQPLPLPVMAPNVNLFDMSVQLDATNTQAHIHNRRVDPLPGTLA